MPPTSVEQAIADLRRQNRRLTRGMAVTLAVCLVSWISGLTPHADAVGTPRGDSILRVRGLVVVDANGTERVWIGAPLPHPPLFGKRYNRGSTVSGILLFDAEGNERSGYVTGDESGLVMITLDEVGRMVARFSSAPRGGVRLQMTGTDGNAVSLGLLDDVPYLRLLREGKTILQERAGSGEAK